MYENLKLEINKGLGWITIDRPEVRNALNAQTLSEIEKAVDDFESHDEVKVIVITGAGEKSFAAGADIQQLRDRPMLEALVPGMQATYKKIENCSKATIAAINGFALGGGCELALACDIRIAVNHAKLGLPELNLGIIPGAGGTQRLSRIVGKGKAMEMILTGKMIDGQEAERIGLVSQSVDGSELEAVVEQVANSIMSKGPVAIKLAKMVINRGYDVDLDTALMMEKMAQALVFGTEDKQEGTQAFLDKRQANFQNK
ncbi:enoyl-CoA hydratase/isomerase family protein [Alkalihalobacterium alkalinitrilicum]|uniref:enoyl-CoA hydratase/isomerase family protein n=1 Tax=Alkalihalobacterium alkalinitrilicum TaxID=427920 RepID=UPI000994A9C7|nr:enoyl-CoA hydratase-related protein [Alkalihalobacterium alkalinitrilicum]